MKIYAFYTPSHRALKDEWFLPTLGGQFEVCVREFPQAGRIEDHVYRTPEFIRTMHLKIGMILEAVEENWGGVFVYSDVDVQFFGDVKDMIAAAIKRRDLLVQRDSPGGGICAGFFACRANEKTRALWQFIARSMADDPELDDQDALNKILVAAEPGWMRGPRHFLGRAGSRAKVFLDPLRPNRFGVRWEYLPESFFSGGVAARAGWQPGSKLCVPGDIVLHHANWTVGVEHKIAQLRYVRDAVRERDARKPGRQPH